MKKLLIIALIVTAFTACNSEDYNATTSGCKLTKERVDQIKEDEAAGILSEADKKVKDENPDCFK